MSVSEQQFNLLAQTRHGPMLFNRHDHYIGRSLAVYGEFSEGEAHIFRQLVGAGQFVVEAGANIGVHTVQLSRLVGNAGQVLAFEPQRIVFQTLCANLALNHCSNVFARQQGVGAKQGNLLAPAPDPRVENNFGGLPLMTAGVGELVDIVTIDSLNLSHCDLIKADVEGMERAVIEGASKSIQKFRPTLYLENDRAESSASLISLLFSLGYRCWWHTPPLFNPMNHAGNTNNIFGNIVSINLLCQPKENSRPVDGLREVRMADETWQSA